ncbi:MAG: CheR family methyltransferase [Candidatus Omnitrophota bacterium]
MNKLDDREISSLLETVYERAGYDFRDYAPSSLRRRIGNIIRDEKLSSIPELHEKILCDMEAMQRFIYAVTVNVTSLFRDPDFYRSFRSEVVPILRTYPFVRLWTAGCSTGEEAYSLAILLEEEEIYSRCRIYATDINEEALRKARGGVYPLSLMKEYSENYIATGGRASLSDINRAYDLGVNSYLVKPANFHAFVSMMKTVGQYWTNLNEKPDLF